MSTYRNAYDILARVREGINEYSADLVQGTHTHGKYNNAQLLEYINRAQGFLFSMLKKRVEGIFVKSASIVATSSIFTLPWDFGSLKELRDASGYRVSPSTVFALPNIGADGTDALYYRAGNTLVLNKSGVAATYTLWYNSIPRDIHAGTMGASSGALAAHLSTSYAPKVDDYYNNMKMESITGDWISTISDYVGSTRVATITQTGVSGHYYGIVPEIPEPLHRFIAPRAIHIAKAEHPASQEKPTRAEIELFAEDLVETMTAFGVDGEDITPEDIWVDFASPLSSPGISIPGQGYLIR